MSARIKTAQFLLPAFLVSVLMMSVPAIPLAVSMMPGPQPTPAPNLKQPAVILLSAKGEANITIMSANLSSNGAVTYFNLTIKNDGNTSVLVYAVSVNGTWDMVMTFAQPPAVAPHGTHGRHAPAPASHFHVIVPRTMPKMFEHKVHMNVVFFVENGTLVPSFEQGHFAPAMKGLLLKPGEKITLSFKGVLSPLPFGAFRRNIFIVPIAGSSYFITLRSVPHSDAHYTVIAE